MTEKKSCFQNSFHTVGSKNQDSVRLIELLIPG
jgi:hypothetical protein